MIVHYYQSDIPHLEQVIIDEGQLLVVHLGLGQVGLLLDPARVVVSGPGGSHGRSGGHTAALGSRVTRHLILEMVNI